MAQFQMFDSATRPQRVAIHWEMETPADEDADVSFLEPDSGRYDDVADVEERERAEANDAERLASYGDEWHMVGVVAVARVMIPIGGASFVTHTFRSAGVWGVESDADDHLRTLFEEQKAELLDQLKTFGAALASGDFDSEDAE